MITIYRSLSAALALIALAALTACDAPHSEEEAAVATAAAHGHEDEDEDETRGPHGGRLLEDGDLMLELAIFETGVPPEFHAWATHGGTSVDPEALDLTVELERLGGRVDRIAFEPAGDRLRGTTSIEEPHSFDVTVVARHDGEEHRWSYESHEGRTTIAASFARAAGIETQIAGPGIVEQTVMLYGTIVPEPSRVRSIGARFPGEIQSVAVALGDRVTAGQTLATVEANESLQRYTVRAPIAGVVTELEAAAGEQTSGAPLLVVADFSTVWAELAVFPRDRDGLAPGSEVRLSNTAGAGVRGTVDYIAPYGALGSQSTLARVVVDNDAGLWQPGQFVEARTVVNAERVDVAVPVAAIQSFRDFEVVFARYGDVYEVRMLEIGRRGAEHVEVLGGLAPGTEYVVAGSYLVKADIEKAGASHDH
jgi:cobalt-zinc-cadmium efflux system membrane fusion protein